jgi:hypothetical protein
MVRAHVRAASALLITITLLAYGCGQNNHTISASDYNQTCSVDTDCVVVASGCGCGEVVAAINGADLARYEADARRAAEGCPTSMEECAPSPPAACAQGTCIVCAYDGCPPKIDAGLDASPE